MHGTTCMLCGGEVDLGDYYHNNREHYIAGNRYPSIDHIRPVSKGGTHTWDNVQLVHRGCNSIKCDNENFPTLDSNKAINR